MKFEITPIIKEVLETVPEARESDRCLMYHFYKRIGVDVTLPWYQINNCSELPHQENIGRIRRKLVEIHPELAGTKSAEERRVEQMQKTREWVLNGCQVD